MRFEGLPGGLERGLPYSVATRRCTKLCRSYDVARKKIVAVSFMPANMHRRRKLAAVAVGSQRQTWAVQE